MGKKFTYADKLNIPFVIIAGKDEVDNGMYTLKDMKSGEQKTLSMDEILEYLR